MENQKEKKSILKKLLVIVVFIVLIVALVTVSLAYTKEKNKKITSADIQALQQQEVGMVLDKIAKHMRLPEGVQPTVATITNVDSLRKEMPFFDNAQNGFKVVVYTDKAILFDPINDIIVDVAPVMQKGADEEAQIIKEEITDESDDSEKTIDEDEDDDSKLEESITEDVGNTKSVEEDELEAGDDSTSE